jgi:hypothetical protein
MASPATAIVIDDPSSADTPPAVATSIPDSIYFDSVWEYFSKPEEGDRFCKCTYHQCGAPISIQKKQTTSNMLLHLRGVHKLIQRDKPKVVRPLTSKPTSTLRNYFTAFSSTLSTSSSRPPPTIAQKRQWTGELLCLVVEMNVSFRAVTESAVLREFMRRELQWEMPSRTALRRLLPIYYTHLMNNLRTQLRDVESISITTDSTFLTRHQVPYICITGHWIDSNWEMHHTVLAVFLAEQGETGQFIANRLREVLEGQLGLSEKVHCVVTDEGKNFLSAVTILKQLEILRESLRCACHRFQLTVKGAMTHPDCRELMAMVQKCQAITLQFKNGWISRKRDILRTHQETHLQELRREVEKLRKEMAEHSTRQKESTLTEKESFLQEAERERDVDESHWRAQREEKAAINQEVSELSLHSTAAVSSENEVSDSDDDQLEEEIKVDDDSTFNFDAMATQQQSIKDVIFHICKKKALVQLAATRWMTYVAVVERTLMWRTALRRALDDISADSSFRKKKAGPNTELDTAALRISDAEATVLHQFQGIGQSCRKTLLALEADDYPTIGSLLYHHSKLFNYLTKAAKVESLDIRVRRFCELAAHNCAVKFNAEIDRPALIGAVLDPRFRQLIFLSAADAGKCKDALTAAFTLLQLEDRDDAPVALPPPAKRRRRVGGEAVVDDFNFDIDQDSPGKMVITNELQRYLALPNEDKDVPALQWWKAHARSYPLLARLARRYLAIPASSAPSERLFSRLKLTATAARQNLKSDTLCMLLFVGAHHSDNSE